MPSTCSCESKKNHCYYLLENWGSGKDGFFNNRICIRNEANSTLTLCTEVNSMCVEDLLLYENIEEHLDDSGVQRCLKQETKSANHEGKNDK